MQTNHTVSEHTHPHPSTPPDAQCHAIIEERDDRPDVCTVYSTAAGDSVTTTWISAESDSYVSLEEHR